MTKSEAVRALEDIEKLLKAIERHDSEAKLEDTDFRQKARRNRRNIDDIVSLINKLDRDSKA